jgi:hypothetical protein
LSLSYPSFFNLSYPSFFFPSLFSLLLSLLCPFCSFPFPVLISLVPSLTLFLLSLP